MAPTSEGDPAIIEDTPMKRRKLEGGRHEASQEKPLVVDDIDTSDNDGELEATLPITQHRASQNGFDGASESLIPPSSRRDTYQPWLGSSSLAKSETQFLSTQPQYVTQPTQLLDQATQNRAEKDSSTKIQVTASSPTPGIDGPSPPLSKPAPHRVQGGALARSMAPAGTAFRLPFGVQRQQEKRVVVDLSDDDGPQYRGNSSSDDEIANTFDIQPSTFEKSGVSLAKKDPYAKGGSERFKEITASSFYDASTKSRPLGLTGSLYDSRNRGRGNSSVVIGAPGGKNNQAARRQAGPERPKPVDDIQLDDIDDFQLRRKVERIRNTLPSVSILVCKTALIKAKGNELDAMDILTSEQDELANSMDLTFSDSGEDDGKVVLSPTTSKPTAKRQVKAPARKIQEKWSSTQALPASMKPPLITPEKPKRRKLIQGRRAPSSPVPLTPETAKHLNPEVTKERPRRQDLSDESEPDSGVASYDSAEEAELEGKVLNFLNTCSVKDLADIASVTEDVAETIVSNRGRGFKDLSSIRAISTETSTLTKTGKKSKARKAIGDRIVSTCLDTWTGYEAIDALVAQCKALGKPLAEEIKKWGFDIFGAAKNGELNMTNLDAVVSPSKAGKADSVRDSGIGTPSSSPTTPGDDSKDDVVKSGPTRSVFVGQPVSMGEGVELKDYQLVGLNWLALLWKHKLSCILADEMGLGKTCQVIAFLAYLYERGAPGPHLIVVPGSTLENWLREFKIFCPKLVVEPYFGLQAERAEIRDTFYRNRDSINVVVTTYDIARVKDDAKFFRSHLRPTVCVYDEGHYLKNSKSARYQALMRIPAQFRVLLTGTPLQNNLRELASLLGFILPKVFAQKQEDLELIFKHKAKTKDDSHDALLSNQRISRAKQMMLPFILRRRKQQVLKHLPNKVCRVEYCDMSSMQSQWYQAQESKLRASIEARVAGDQSKSDIGNPMMILRKAAIHPMLFRRQFTDEMLTKMAKACLKEPEYLDSVEELVYEDMQVMTDLELYHFCDNHPTTMSSFQLEGEPWMDSGKVQKLAELLKRYKDNGDRCLVFSQFTIVLDILDSVLETLDISYFRLDGQTKIDERQDMIDEFYADSSITVFLLSTKAGGSGINLACANKVIIFDSSFNPQEDIQAENRAHRVGQTRDVEVVRLVTTGTIEEAIAKLGETKLVLDDRVAGDDKDGEKLEKIGEDLVAKMLLGGDGEETKTVDEASMDEMKKSSE